MAFESLSFRHTFTIDGFPERWLPLIHLYDPDLPLFPIYYFHILSSELGAGQRAIETDRAFGYIEKISLSGENTVDVTVITNKNLELPRNKPYISSIKQEILERLGLSNCVKQNDIISSFKPPLDYANGILNELWERVVNRAYGGILPFGRMWDETLGLARYVASFYSQSGRKGELIQTHYFASKYGARINCADGFPQIDFFLLPTISEVTDNTNPLAIFPDYAALIEIANIFQKNNCKLISIDGINLSKFVRSYKGALNTEKILAILNSHYIPARIRHLGIECFNTFGKGPLRTVIFLLMLSDLRNKRLQPANLSTSELGSIYDGLKGSSQSPKVIHIYAQQSFGNIYAMPIDTWIKTFLKWPLKVYPTKRSKTIFKDIFNSSSKLGKLERLLWVAAQARKVHSSACNDAIWCTKLSSTKEPRGANPLACNICMPSIRTVCPSYNEIKNRKVFFNTSISNEQNFLITTSAGNNTSPNQIFISCKGMSIYADILDDFSPADSPGGFSSYPNSKHNGKAITVEEFVDTY